LIRATRDWGGPDGSGTAFGLLDGGRGALSAVLALVAAQAFMILMPADVEAASLADRAAALQNIIYMYVAATLGAAVVVWFAVPASGGRSVQEARSGSLWKDMPTVVRMPALWLQSLIVLAAYIAYKGTDDYGLFARDAYGFNDVESAWISTVSAWVRPFAALFAGWIADRVLSSRVVAVGFAILIVTYGAMASLSVEGGVVAVLVIEIVVACIAVYGLRGVYFALFEEASVPPAVTGTAVGLVSLVGYTPDIFVGLVSGHFLDGWPGVQGHQYFFWFLASAAVVGLVSTLLFGRVAATTSPRA
jgi:nitrate/nitrite transporter NarK